MKISKLYIFGNRATCSHCRKLATIIKESKFTAWLKSAGVTVIDCDKTENAKVYVANIRVVGYKGGQWPQVFAASDTGKILGSFVARGVTAATLISKVKALCADCCERAACTDVPVKTKQCPTCKGAGVVAVALAAILTLVTGCAVTNIKTPEASGWRCAFLYPFEMGSAKIKTANGSAEIGNYKTSGGAAELVPLVDASGKLIGTFIGAAAKEAVTP